MHYTAFNVYLYNSQDIKALLMWSTKVENEKKSLFASTLPDFVFCFDRVLNASAVRQQQTVSVNNFKLVGHGSVFLERFYLLES